MRCSVTDCEHSYWIKRRTATSRQDKPGPQESHQAWAEKVSCQADSSAHLNFIQHFNIVCIKAMGLSTSGFFAKRITRVADHCWGNSPVSSARLKRVARWSHCSLVSALAI